ncbi:GNAT family N-acetyltransferase [Actinospongicola halichondriae]|uniref:GNAT family N-acetyltransferase n=1 Tax=Actinospongicola halichondriae TaxID=3236844 RepID=UPI003D4DF484
MSEIEVRRMGRDDTTDIVGLAARSLGWAGDDRDRAFFEWKHFESPFGDSPSWGAFDGDRLVAFRTLMKWRLDVDGEPLDVVRAVDTATDPEYQGRGLFRRLTMTAVDELAAAGVDAVFNTPNEQSRPGYLKMGWSIVGRPTLMVQPSGPVTLARLVRARVPAEKWSIPVDLGIPIHEAIDADVPLSRFGSSEQEARQFLLWRYGLAPLHYRAVSIRGGICIFRVRRRGPLREVAICEWLSERRDPMALRRIVRAVGDYAVAVGLTARNGLIPLPRQGPIVTWRPLARAGVPGLDDVRLSLGDLELF